MKVRCASCNSYRPKEEMHQRVSLAWVCSEACARAYRYDRKPRAAIKQKAPNSATLIPDDVRAKVVARDDGRCRFCGTPRGVDLHHVVYRSQGGKHTPDNLLSLCGVHHALVHSSKRRFMPLCKGVLWLMYEKNQRVTIPQLERWLHNHEVGTSIRSAMVSFGMEDPLDKTEAPW